MARTWASITAGASRPPGSTGREETHARWLEVRDSHAPNQRLCSQQAYYLYVSPSAKVLSAWEPYVKNFARNISLDYGGRLMIAWLDK